MSSSMVKLTGGLTLIMAVKLLLTLTAEYDVRRAGWTDSHYSIKLHPNGTGRLMTVLNDGEIWFSHPFTCEDVLATDYEVRRVKD